MYSLKFKCKVITPLFMYGADGITPELRSSEFKGMMRFWWRAIKSESDINKLRKEEAKIFGGSGNVELKSKVNIKIIPENISIGNNLKDNYRFNWESDGVRRTFIGNHSGIGYLFYSCVLPRNEKKFIKPDSTFSIRIESLEKKSFINAVASFWLSIYLGGFGTRSRRCGGNIYIERLEGDYLEEFPEFITNISDTNKFIDFLKNNIEKCFKLVNGGKRAANFVSEYSNLSFSRIIISNSKFNDWIEAVNDIGVKYKIFREQNRNRIFETSAFGFPVMHRRTIVKAKLNKENIERRVSPLVFKVAKINNDYIWYILRLSGEFLPEDAVVLAQGTKKVNYKIIDAFRNSLISNEIAIEYVLTYPEIISSLVEKVKNKVKSIILFGSRARCDAHKNSDIDIAIDTDNSIESLDINGPFDIVKMGDNLDERLENTINDEGVFIYERKN